MWLPPGPASVIVRRRASLHCIDCAAVPSALLARNYKHRTKKKKRRKKQGDVAPLLANKLFVSTVCTLKNIYFMQAGSTPGIIYTKTQNTFLKVLFMFPPPAHCAPPQVQPHVTYMTPAAE